MHQWYSLIWRMVCWITQTCQTSWLSYMISYYHGHWISNVPQHKVSIKLKVWFQYLFWLYEYADFVFCVVCLNLICCHCQSYFPWPAGLWWSIVALLTIVFCKISAYCHWHPESSFSVTSFHFDNYLPQLSVAVHSPQPWGLPVTYNLRRLKLCIC